jgi:hypothetical protein
MKEHGSQKANYQTSGRAVIDIGLIFRKYRVIRHNAAQNDGYYNKKGGLYGLPDSSDQ